MKRLLAALLLLGCSAGASQVPTPRDRVAQLVERRVEAAQAAGSTPAPVTTPSGEIGTALIGGVISYVDAKYGPSYLALPFPRGTVATVCGPADCVTRRSTDFGPDQRVHPNRIADVSAADFVRICGVPLSAGLCRGTVEIEPPVHPDDDRMRAEDLADQPLPATDSTEGEMP